MHRLGGAEDKNSIRGNYKKSWAHQKFRKPGPDVANDERIGFSQTFISEDNGVFFNELLVASVKIGSWGRLQRLLSTKGING